MSDRREEKEFHGENEDVEYNYIFDCTQELSDRGDDFTIVYNEFIDYKVRSSVSEELPAPDVDTQKDFSAVNDLFGKDKPNAPHSKLSKIHSKEQLEHNIHHLHTFDGSRNFPKWQVNKQWLNVSNTFVIYSFFKHKKVFYFYILDLVLDNGCEEIPDGGHEALLQPVLVQQWIDDAKAFEAIEIQK
jgi:hypothetical protein